MEIFYTLSRFLGFVTVKYLFPKRMQGSVHPESDLAAWIGFVECLLTLVFGIFLIVLFYG